MLKIQMYPGFLALLSTDSLHYRKASTKEIPSGSTAVDNDIKHIFSAVRTVEKEK